MHDHEQLPCPEEEERIKKQAAAVLAPWHGLFTIGNTLEAAFDATERINLNAQLILECQRLSGAEQLRQRTGELRQSLAAFQNQ